MRPVLFTLEYPPFKGGVAHYYAHLVNASAEEIAVHDNSQQDLVNSRLPMLAWLPSFKTMRDYIGRGFDYFLIGQILPLGTAAWLLSYTSKIRYTVFLHGYDLNAALSHPRKRWLAKQILKRADKIIAANSYTAKQLHDLLPTQVKKIKLLNPGVNAADVVLNTEAAAKLKQRCGLTGPVLLTVGRLVARKGFDTVINQLPAWLQTWPQLTYVIVGRGPEEANLKKLISNLNLTQHVLVLTEVSDREKSLWYQVADVFVMVARQSGDDVEGFGIVYLEAGLASKPVIAAEVGGVADAVQNNVNGLLIDHTPKALTEAVNRLLSDGDLARYLGEQGRQRALNDFSWANQAKAFWQFINS